MSNLPAPVPAAWRARGLAWSWRGVLGRGRRWAVTRSASLAGLLYLPVPEEPIVRARPRSAPTPLRPLDPEGLARARTRVAGRVVSLEPPVGWADALGDPALRPLHDGEEVLGLLRLHGQRGSPGLLELGWRVLEDWVQANPIACGPGWEPGPLARRLACWCAGFAESGPSVGPREQRLWRQSLYLQARFLYASLDGHRGGAEVLTGLRALLGAASLLSGSEPRGWLQAALRWLPEQLGAQFAADGGHLSRVPAIHLRALGDVLDCLALLPSEAEAWRAARERLPAVLRFARALSHPDGSPAGFGGSFREQSPEVATLAALAGLPAASPGSTSFPQSAFSALHLGKAGDAILVDWLGPEGDSAEPGASGSFEASFGGLRFVVTPQFPSPDEASWTHNSARTDGAPFRPRSHRGPVEASWGNGPEFAYLGLAARTGTRELHRRMLGFTGRALVVIDRVQGAEHHADSLVQLAPGVRMEPAGRRRLFLRLGDQAVTLAWIPGLQATTETGTLRADGGDFVSAPRLRFSVPGGATRLLGYALAAGLHPGALVDVLEGPDEQIGLRLDSHRYVVRWAQDGPPRLLLAQALG